MADSDTAFLWETEALRSSKAAKGRHEQPSDRVDRDDVDWITLREATDLTGIPVSTLRKWARRDSVPTYLEETPVGQLRMVSLKGIQRRAGKLGRKLETTSPPMTIEVQEPKRAPGLEPERKLEATEPESEGAEPESEGAEPEIAGSEIPEGTMLVPLDAWNKMLMQLGNLHEAGQQLADARERAAKAETETTFLRERLDEMRSELAEAKMNAPPTPIIVEPQQEPAREPAREPQREPAPRVPVHEPAESQTPDIDNEEGEVDESSFVDIPVRDLGSPDLSEEPEELFDQDDLLTLPAYSLAMMKHVYTTWRGRPRR